LEFSFKPDEYDRLAIGKETSLERLALAFSLFPDLLGFALPNEATIALSDLKLKKLLDSKNNFFNFKSEK